MPLALSPEHCDLADSVAAWSRRNATTESTRARLDGLATGELPDSWGGLVEQGLHAIHLPEERGGAGAALPDLAVVVEQLGRALYPGPFLTTVTASAVAAAMPDDERVHRVVEEYATGATGALVHAPGLTARSDGDGWIVDGTSAPVLGLPGADIVLVRADGLGQGTPPVWFRLGSEAHASTGQVHVDQPTDLTRSVGRLELTGHRIDAVDVLPAPDSDHVDLVMLALLAADASGVARWCLEVGS